MQNKRTQSTPRVFTSYARSDGDQYATWLRQELESKEPELK